MNDDLSIGAPGEGGDIVRELPDTGNHQAVCSMIVNIGHQEYKGQVSESPKCVILFEIEQAVKAGKYAGQQMAVSDKFAMYMGEGSKLRKFMENWRGRPYTPEELKNFSLRKSVGQPATLTVIHNTGKNGKTYANIAGIARPKPGSAVVVPQMKDVPKWITDLQGKAVQPPVKAQPVKAGNPNTSPAPEDDLPF